MVFEMVKHGDHDIENEDLADRFIEALKKGFKNEALGVVSDPDFDPDARAGLPLSVAIELGYLDIAHGLVTAGANPNLGTDSRKGAMVLALENEYFDLADSLLQHGAEIAYGHRDHTIVVNRVDGFTGGSVEDFNNFECFLEALFCGFEIAHLMFDGTEAVDLSGQGGI